MSSASCSYAMWKARWEGSVALPLVASSWADSLLCSASEVFQYTLRTIPSECIHKVAKGGSRERLYEEGGR
jgi:hypothetical protein